MKKTFIYTAAIASMVLALASCEKEPGTINEPKDGMRLHVVSNDIQTKAQQTSTNRIVSETIDLSEGDVNLFFTAVEEDNLGNEFLMEPQTKGTIITTANFADERSGDFHLWLTRGGNQTYFEADGDKGAKDVPVILKGDSWYAMYEAGNESYGNYIHWPSVAGTKLDFWCWSGAENAKNIEITSDGKNMTFDYADNSSTASAQKDLLFAFAGNQTEPSTKGDVDIHFFHALSAVQFCVGGLDKGVKITDIKLTGVKNSGRGAYVPSGKCTIPGTDISKDMTSGEKDVLNGNTVENLFVWTEVAGSKTYSTGTIGRNNTSTATQYDPIGDEATSTFFFVPQDIKDIEIEISVTSSNGSQTNTLKKKIGLGSVSYETMKAWKAGKIYRYTISGSGEVKVAVAEKLDGVDVVGGSTSEITTTKAAVSGLNNGTLKSYIRAAVVGNWYNEAGQIVAPFNSSSVLPTTLADGWFSVAEGSDANCNVLFYYYKDAVEPGAQTATNLIESYTKANAAPIAGAHLELNIIMQAVDARDGKAAAAEAWKIDASKLN
ncbi:MAG: fimbrillin family protein [Bacteroidales bacterium]|nr:fimbrillin family protein [Bacteroidales bacterium]